MYRRNHNYPNPHIGTFKNSHKTLRCGVGCVKKQYFRGKMYLEVYIGYQVMKNLDFRNDL